jgi:hypothetical protein
VLSVILESVPSIRDSYGSYFNTVEWIFTGLFTIEYAARLATAKDPRRYSLSFFGIVDLLAIAPIYLSVLFAVEHSYTVVRSLRLLRVFRGRDAASCADLMGYLLFTSKYTQTLIDTGYHDADQRIDEIEDFLYSSNYGDNGSPPTRGTGRDKSKSANAPARWEPIGSRP